MKQNNVNYEIIKAVDESEIIKLDLSKIEDWVVNSKYLFNSFNSVKSFVKNTFKK